MLNEWQLLRWNHKSVKLNKNTKKMNCFSSKSVIHIIYNEPVEMMKRGEGNIVGGILLTTESYMIIFNILKTVNLEKQ